MQDKKKKSDSPYETIQLLKTDTDRLMKMAMAISVANGDEFRKPPCPATMVNHAVTALEILSKPTTKITRARGVVLH